MKKLHFGIVAAVALATLASCSQEGLSPVGDTSEEQASHRARPRLPQNAMMRFESRYVETGFVATGYQYYSETLKKWRFDVLFRYDAAAIAAYPDAAEMAEFDFTAADGTFLYSYHFDTTSFSWVCYPLPLPKWWSYDYLDGAEYVGKEELDGVPVDVYSNDDVWPGTVVLTYVSRSSGEIMRHFYDQPFNDWYMDFLDTTTVDVSSWGGTFDVPATLAALPCP